MAALCAAVGDTPFGLLFTRKAPFQTKVRALIKRDAAAGIKDLIGSKDLLTVKKLI